MADQSTKQLYAAVMEDVIEGMKEVFLDEGIDSSVLRELRDLWQSKMLACKAVDTKDCSAAAIRLFEMIHPTLVPSAPLFPETDSTLVPATIRIPASSDEVTGVIWPERTVSIKVPAYALKDDLLTNILARPEIMANLKTSGCVQEVIMNAIISEHDSSVQELREIKMESQDQQDEVAAPTTSKVAARKMSQQQNKATRSSKNIDLKDNTEDNLEADNSSRRKPGQAKKKRNIPPNKRTKADNNRQRGKPKGSTARSTSKKFVIESSEDSEEVENSEVSEEIESLSSDESDEFEEKADVTRKRSVGKKSKIASSGSDEELNVIKEADLKPPRRSTRSRTMVNYIDLDGAPGFISSCSSSGSESEGQESEIDIDLIVDDDNAHSADEEANPAEDETPLNSGDDDPEWFDVDEAECENVIVCQYDKITRNKDKWQFHLKDGIMNIKGKDYHFCKAFGSATW